jgi:hypothetical protein
MAFSEELAERIRQELVRKKGIEEKKMFGGIGFLLNGNLLVGVAFSGETREGQSITALGRALEAREVSDAAGEARALLACARASQDNLDLWDPGDIAAAAAAVARDAGLREREADARAFVREFNGKLVPPTADP